MSKTDATPSRKSKSFRKVSIGRILMKGRAFVALILVVVVFTFLTPNFLSAGNIQMMSKHVAQNALLAIGMTFVILSGGIDLSVGSIVGLTAMIAGGLINEGIVLPMFGVVVYPHTWTIIVISLLAGTLMGAISGLCIARFRVAPFIATLGMMYVARGFALLLNNGYTFANLIGRPELGNTGFPELGASGFLSINYSIWIMVVFTLVAAFVAAKTPLGRHVYAIGGNEHAAELSGVPVSHTKVIVYMISGFCAAMVGLIIASQLVAAHPATGVAFEMNAIAAVVLGGTSLAGGRGSIPGTILGAFVIGVLSDGLIMVGVSSFWQQVIKGMVIVLAVIIDQIQARAQERLALQQQYEITSSEGVTVSQQE